MLYDDVTEKSGGPRQTGSGYFTGGNEALFLSLDTEETQGG